MAGLNQLRLQPTLSKSEVRNNLLLFNKNCHLEPEIFVSVLKSY